MNSLRLDRVAIKKIAEELRSGKSIARAFVNLAASQVELSGQLIDLGSKSTKASYHRSLKFREPYQITFTDVKASEPGIIELDLERSLPLSDESYDAVLCFNLLEHIFNFQAALQEIFRILKSGGRLIGSVPFLVNFHPDPNDYFRYTHQALEQLMKQAGFSQVTITYLGLGPLTSGLNLRLSLWPAVLRPLAWRLTCWLDQQLIKRRPAVGLRYPLSYFFTAQKP